MLCALKLALLTGNWGHTTGVSAAARKLSIAERLRARKAGGCAAAEGNGASCLTLQPLLSDAMHPEFVEYKH